MSTTENYATVLVYYSDEWMDEFNDVTLLNWDDNYLHIAEQDDEGFTEIVVNLRRVVKIEAVR